MDILRQTVCMVIVPTMADDFASDTKFLHANNEVSDQTVQIRRLI